MSDVYPTYKNAQPKTFGQKLKRYWIPIVVMLLVVSNVVTLALFFNEPPEQPKLLGLDLPFLNELNDATLADLIMPKVNQARMQLGIDNETLAKLNLDDVDLEKYGFTKDNLAKLGVEDVDMDSANLGEIAQELSQEQMQNVLGKLGVDEEAYVNLAEAGGLKYQEFRDLMSGNIEREVVVYEGANEEEEDPVQTYEEARERTLELMAQLGY
jgi:hypothetical protein